MRILSRSPLVRFWRFALGAGMAAWLLLGDAPALTTGVPISLTVEPATVRQKDAGTSTVTATVQLKSPAPTVFVCELRSKDGAKLNFGTIIFRIGETGGKASGTVHWRNVRQDCSIKISAFSTDDPSTQVVTTVFLKLKD